MEIGNRFSGKVIYSGDFKSLKELVLNALSEGVNLKGVNLKGVNLSHANLVGANLSGVNLSGVNLWQCSGNRSEIKSLFISNEYPITYTSECLQIGCKNYPIADWWGFDNKRILSMDGNRALKFWREHKEFIKMSIDKFPAKETGHES